MTRSQLIEAVARKLDLDRATAERTVRLVFDTMAEALLRGEGIELRGFGSFSVREYRPYRGRNPRNGAVVEVAGKRSAVFKVGKPFRARIEESAGRAPVSIENGARRARAAAGGEPLADDDAAE